MRTRVAFPALLTMAALLPGAGFAQVAPPGAVIDLGTATPPATSGYTQYTATVTAPSSGLYYALFAFREDPAYFRFDDASVTAAGSSTNLLTNPGFEGATTTGTNGLPIPTGWGAAYQIGRPPPASGRVNSDNPHTGSSVWYDGSVGSFDAIYQTFQVVSGQSYLISFFLNADDAFSTPQIEMATYFGSCGTSTEGCTTAFGNGFVVSRPPNPTIDTTNGDIAPNVFSLGSPAATASTVQFDGGILRMQGGAFADNIVTAPVLLSSLNGTVDTGPASGGFSGVVSGPGSLTVTGANTFLLSGNNTYAGGTLLNGGTLAVGSSTALGAGGLAFGGGRLAAAADALSLANAMTLSVDGTIDTAGYGLTVSGAVSGQGRLVKAGAGSLTLTGDNSFAGGTLVQGGTLALGSDTALGTGALALDDGTTVVSARDRLTIGNAIAFTGLADPTIDTGPNTLTLNGDITGGGALTKLGSGTLILGGNDSYTGATAIAAGTLQVDGAITVSPITVANGAALAGSGAIASFTAASGAVVIPSSAANGLRVTGAATFQPGSTFAVTVNPDGSNTKLAVGGSATLGGARLSVLAGSGTFSAARYTLLTAAGGVNGTFGSVSTASALALLRPTVSYTPNDVVLTLSPVAFATQAATPNQAATARAIQALGAGNALYDAVLQQNQAGARQAFAAASGVAYPTAGQASRTNTRFTTGLVIDRLWDVSGNGLSAQQVLEGFAPDRTPLLTRCYAPLQPTPPPPPPSFTAWGEGFGVFGHTDATANAGSSDRSLGGFVLGVDTPLHAVLDGWRGGVAVGYTNTRFTSSLDEGRGSVQGVYGSLYAGARYGSVDVRVGTTVGGTFVDAKRTVAFPGFAEVEKSHSAGATVQTFGEVGYRIPVGPGVVEPVAGAAYLHAHQNGFDEEGGVAAVRAAGLDTDLGITTLGFRGEVQPLPGVPMVAHVFVGWQHSFGDLSPATTLAFEAAPANTFSVTGVPLDRDAVAAELALDYRVTSALDLGASYAGLAGARAADHAVKGRAEYRF